MGIKMKKILIAYANAGAGHKRAAYAVANAFEEIKRDDVEVKVVDTMDYATPFFKKNYPVSYLFMVNKIPVIWGLFYYLLDTRIFYYCIARIARRIHNALGFKGLEQFLRSEEHTSELQSQFHLVCRLLLEKK